MIFPARHHPHYSNLFCELPDLTLAQVEAQNRSLLSQVIDDD